MEAITAPSFPSASASSSPLDSASTSPSRSSQSADHSSEAPESSFREVLERLGEHVDAGEKMVQRMTSPTMVGGDGATQLLALQAGIYRYSEVVDLSAKLVDRASNSIKTTLQSQ